jgi:hypothetical protein
MTKSFVETGYPTIWRNDRFWLAGDHVVDPRIFHIPKIQELIGKSEKAKNDYKMTEFQGFNVCNKILTPLRDAAMLISLQFWM